LRFFLTVFGRQLALQGQNLTALVLGLLIKGGSFGAVLLPLLTNLGCLLELLSQILLFGKARRVDRLIDAYGSFVDGVLCFPD
jgi:hypothetical protein